MVSVVVTRRRISILNDVIHLSLYLECFIRWWYSRKLHVLLSRTAYARSHRNCIRNVWLAAWRAVNGALYMGLSIMVSM